jgi:GNAT superfamily N-acetyltransferase
MPDVEPDGISPWPEGRIASPPDLAPEVVSLAENSNLHHPRGPGSDRIEDPRYVVFLGPGSFAGFTVVQRLRIDEDGVDSTVREIRALLDERGRVERTWEIGSSATPSDLTERLLKMGMVPDREPYAVGMVLDAPPDPGPPGVEAHRVTTREDFVASTRIAMESFGMSGKDLEEAMERSDEEWEAQRSSEDVAQFIARIDGEPVAQARATFTEHGVLLNGGATLERARGRGAYRALVRARWDEADRRGVRCLVTQAGAMSRPILARLGFREVCDVRILLDAPGAGRPEDG